MNSEEFKLEKGSKIAIVGVGTSGVHAVRWARDKGYQPVGFERTDSIGGIWKHKPPPSHSPAYDSLCTNSSSVLMNISDYPFPFKTDKIFPRHDEIVKYYEMFIHNRSLKEFIHLNTDVIKIQKRESDKKWDVFTHHVLDEKKDSSIPGSKKSHESDTLDHHIFDGVLICTGKHWDPEYPPWAHTKFGKNLFKGRISHSHDYRNPQLFAKKNVLVVGIGNSALDISLELARDPNVQKPVRVAVRRGTVILPVEFDDGSPVDMFFGTRLFQYGLPGFIRKFYFAKHVISVNQEFRKYGLPEPEKGVTDPSSQVSNLNKTRPYLEALRNGSIVFVGEVLGCVENGTGKDVYVSSSSRNKNQTKEREVISNVDEIICCTGYRLSLDFLSPQLREEVVCPIDVGNGKIVEALKLYNHITLPDNPTLCFIGFVTSLGNESVIGELQARWCVDLWSNPKRTLPTKNEMSLQVERNLEKLRKLKPKVSNFVQYVPYMDMLAEDLGASIKLQDHFWKDPILAWKLFMYPLVPSQYRLVGNDSWSGARDFLARL